MLTTRVLPPILRSPRMQPLSAQLLSSALAQDQSALLTIMGRDSPRKAFEKAQDNSASPREPSNTMLARYTSSPIPARRSKASDEVTTEEPTFVRRPTRKRAASLVYIEEDKPKSDNDPTYQRSSNSAPSTGSGEFSGHICLCQPEPKIPRPRNGEFCLLFVRKQYS